MDSIKNIIEHFKLNIKNALIERGIESNIDFDVVIPKVRDFGDLSTNAAFKLSKPLNKSPLDIAKTITESLNEYEMNISKVEIVKPGFINFYLNDKWVKLLGDMVLRNSINIIDKEEIKEDYINIHYDKKSSSFIRAKTYGSILKDILEFKGHNVYLSFSEESTLKDSDRKNIKVGDMRLLEYGKVIDKPIEDVLNKAQIHLWSISKTCSSNIDIPLEIVSLNDLINPFFYITYVYRRASNMVSILEKEGYTIDKLQDKDLSFNPVEGRNLILKILDFEGIIEETVKFKEPYKLYDYVYSFSTDFYHYNNKLLLREQSKNHVESNLYVLRVVQQFFYGIIDMLKLNIYSL